MSTSRSASVCTSLSAHAIHAPCFGLILLCLAVAVNLVRDWPLAHSTSHLQFAYKSTAGGVVALQRDEVSALINTLRGPLQLSINSFLVVSFPTATEARKCQFFWLLESSSRTSSKFGAPKRKANIWETTTVMGYGKTANSGLNSKSGKGVWCCYCNLDKGRMRPDIFLRLKTSTVKT